MLPFHVLFRGESLRENFLIINESKTTLEVSCKFTMAAKISKLKIILILISVLEFEFTLGRPQNLKLSDGNLRTFAIFPNTHCLTGQFQRILNLPTNFGQQIESCTRNAVNLGSNVIQRVDSFADASDEILRNMEQFITCGNFFCQGQSLIEIVSNSVQIYSDITWIATDLFSSPLQIAPTTVQCFADVFSGVGGAFINVISCFPGGRTFNDTSNNGGSTGNSGAGTGNSFGFPGLPGFGGNSGNQNSNSPSGSTNGGFPGIPGLPNIPGIPGFGGGGNTGSNNQDNGNGRGGGSGLPGFPGIPGIPVFG